MEEIVGIAALLMCIVHVVYATATSAYGFREVTLRGGGIDSGTIIRWCFIWLDRSTQRQHVRQLPG